MGSSGHGANIYFIHNVKTDKRTVVGTLQSAKKGLAHTLRRRAQGGMPNPLDALARTEGVGANPSDQRNWEFHPTKVYA